MHSCKCSLRFCKAKKATDTFSSPVVFVFKIGHVSNIELSTSLDSQGMLKIACEKIKQGYSGSGGFITENFRQENTNVMSGGDLNFA